MRGALIPDMTSKFLPSKVISSGIIIYINNLNKTISTGTRTICNNVNAFISKLSINIRPLLVANSRMINSIGGITNNKNRGGIVSVTV